MFFRANTQSPSLFSHNMLAFYKVKTLGSKIRKSFHKFRKQDCLNYVCNKPWESSPRTQLKKKKSLQKKKKKEDDDINPNQAFADKK